jgi:hypothetical protein
MINSREVAQEIADLIEQGDFVKLRNNEWYECTNTRFSVYDNDIYLYGIRKNNKYYGIRLMNIKDILFVNNHEEKYRIFKSLLTLDKLSR